MVKVEQAAVDFVLDYERRNGGNPRDVSKERRGFDIESGNKIIEVKGRGTEKPPFVEFNQYNFAAMQRALKEGKEFWLCIVYNINNGNPKLIKLDVIEIIKRADFVYHWEIPVRARDRQ